MDLINIDQESLISNPSKRENYIIELLSQYCNDKKWILGSCKVGVAHFDEFHLMKLKDSSGLGYIKIDLAYASENIFETVLTSFGFLKSDVWFAGIWMASGYFLVYPENELDSTSYIDESNNEGTNGV